MNEKKQKLIARVVVGILIFSMLLGLVARAFMMFL